MRTAAWSAAGAAVLFASAGVASRFAAADIPSSLIGAARLVLGGAVLALLPGPGTIAPALAAAPLLPLAAAALAMAVCQWTFFAAVADGGVAVASVASVGAAPIAADALTFILERRRPGLRFAACAALTALSLLLCARGASLAAVLLSTISACAYAAYTMATRRVEREQAAGLAITAVALLMGGLVLLAVAAAHSPVALSRRTLFVGAYLGLVATAAAYVLFIRALKELSAARALDILLLQPLAAMLAGAWLFGERVDASLLGALAVVAAAIAIRALPAGPSRFLFPGS